MPSPPDTAADWVPFLVVATTGVLIAVSFVPVYVIALGGTASAGVATALVAAGGFAILAYRRLGTGRDGRLRREIPPAARLRTIVYGVLVGAALLGGLSILLYLAR